MSSQTKAEADLFSEKELRALLARAENPLVERKTEGDFKDIRRTAVAFANSLPVGVPGIIFYPAKDDGTAEKQLNLDSVQKKIVDQLKRPFPPLLFTFRVVEALGIDVLAIIVFGSETRPHFSDRSFVRRGSQTFEASSEEFDRLIAERNSKTRKILESRGSAVTLSEMNLPDAKAHALQGQHKFRAEAIVIDCNQFWVTLGKIVGRQPDERSYPLYRVQLSFDDVAKRLEIEVLPAGTS